MYKIVKWAEEEIYTKRTRFEQWMCRVVRSQQAPQPSLSKYLRLTVVNDVFQGKRKARKQTMSTVRKPTFANDHYIQPYFCRHAEATQRVSVRHDSTVCMKPPPGKWLLRGCSQGTVCQANAKERGVLERVEL